MPAAAARMLAGMGCAGYLPSTKYDLVSNVCHEGKPADGFYKCHLLNKANKEWCVCTLPK
jgi:ubiquitin C-terminal hydrolase